MDGITVVREDWKDLYARYKDVPGVVFIADTPYVNTYMHQYGKGWKTKDHFGVMETMGGHKFVLFTSNKTGTLDSCELMDGVTKEGSPLKGAKILKRDGHSNGYCGGYTDIMIFRP